MSAERAEFSAIQRSMLVWQKAVILWISRMSRALVRRGVEGLKAGFNIGLHGGALSARRGPRPPPVRKATPRASALKWFV